jgi:phosphate transport system substrate-binding protein
MKRLPELIAFVVFGVMFVALSPSCTPTPEGESVLSGKITVVCDESAYPLVKAEADTFMKLYTKAIIAVEPKSTREALADLYNQGARLAVTNRELTEEEARIALENKIKPVAYKFAVEAVAFVVNPANRDSEMTVEALAKVLSGEVKDWGKVGKGKGPILVVLRNENFGDYEFVKKEILLGKDYAKEVYKVNNTEQVLEAVAKEKGAIGIVGMTWINDKVKPLALKRAEEDKFWKPDIEGIHYRTYPVLHFLYFYHRGEAEKLASGFITYVTSTEGQKVAYNNGYYPATAPTTTGEH